MWITPAWVLNPLVKLAPGTLSHGPTHLPSPHGGRQLPCVCIRHDSTLFAFSSYASSSRIPCAARPRLAARLSAAGLYGSSSSVTTRADGVPFNSRSVSAILTSELGGGSLAQRQKLADSPAGRELEARLRANDAGALRAEAQLRKLLAAVLGVVGDGGCSRALGVIVGCPALLLLEARELLALAQELREAVRSYEK